MEVLIVFFDRALWKSVYLVLLLLREILLALKRAEP